MHSRKNHSQKYPHPLIGLSMLVWAMLFAGCGGAGDGIARVAVSGKVTLDEVPLESGYIAFVPKDKGAAAVGPITNGAYSFSSKDGPAEGAYRVEINAMKATGKKIPDRDGAEGATMDEMLNRIPAHYNVKSELRAEVSATGNAAFDFTLSSKPGKSSSATGTNKRFDP